MNFIKTILNIIKAFSNTDAGKGRKPEHEKEIVRTKSLSILIHKDFLTLNRYSRPGKKRTGVKAIEIHWVANPGTSAKFNRDYFELRKGGKLSFGSTHYIVDLDGDIVQLIPEEEIAYSSGASSYKPGVTAFFGNPPYKNTISIECTHTNGKGEMSSMTYSALIALCTYLCKKYGLQASDLVLHHDLTGKLCHKWFVDNPEEWIRFREAVKTELSETEHIEISYTEGGYND